VAVKARTATDLHRHLAGSSWFSANKSICRRRRAALCRSGTGCVIEKIQNPDLQFLGSIGLLLFGAIMAYWMKPNEPLPGAEMGTVSGRVS
jgi:hypothetical protein